MEGFEASIKTKFGELKIPFVTREELETKLKDAEAFVKIIDQQARVLGISEIEKLPGLEDILFVNKTDGLIKLFRTPNSRPKTVGLVVYGYYCYYPNGGTAKQISKSSCVEQVPRTILNHPDYKRYFSKSSEKTYKLSQEGLHWVTEEIIPDLRPKKNSNF